MCLGERLGLVEDKEEEEEGAQEGSKKRAILQLHSLGGAIKIDYIILILCFRRIWGF